MLVRTAEVVPYMGDLGVQRVIVKVHTCIRRIVHVLFQCTTRYVLDLSSKLGTNRYRIRDTHAQKYTLFISGPARAHGGGCAEIETKVAAID
jgi:hypothetical protein